MKSIVDIGPNASAAAYRGTHPSEPIGFAMHEFLATPDGQLQHHMDGQLRATIPPEGFDAYEASWPACKPVLDELRGAEASAVATLRLPAPKPAAKKKAARRK